MERLALDTTFLIDLQNERRGRGKGRGARDFLRANPETELLLPVDVMTETGVVDVSRGLSGDQKALDIGPKTIAAYDEVIRKARTVFWNGPMGVFEKKEFAKGTMAMARAVAEANATTVVGGGESVEAVNQSGYADRISHISTGGGASLEFISGADLPGVEVLRQR